MPTTSDIFKRDGIGKEVTTEASESATGGALGAWAKQHDPRSTAGAMEARLANGHTNGTANHTSPASEKVAEKTNNRFPGLSDYLGGTRSEPVGAGFGHVGKVGSVFSPRKVGSVMAGGLGGESVHQDSIRLV